MKKNKSRRLPAGLAFALALAPALTAQAQGNSQLAPSRTGTPPGAGGTPPGRSTLAPPPPVSSSPLPSPLPSPSPAPAPAPAPVPAPQLLPAAAPAPAPLPQSSQIPVLPTLVTPSVPELPPFSQRSDLPPTLQFRVGQSLLRDSNVFRASEANQQSDTYGVTTLGVKFDKRYSLQRLELDVYAQDFKYKEFSALNFTALNYNAAWRWSVTPKLRGNLTADQREFVDNSADGLLGFDGSVNRRTESSLGLDAEYELGAAWRVLGGVFQRELKNTRTTAEADATVTGAEVGAGYVFRSGNSLSYRLKSGDGQYRGQAGVGLPRDFTDTEHEVRFDWAPTGRTTVQARLAYLDRAHQGTPERDYSGVAGRVNANWVITGKTQLDAGYIRDLNSFQTTSTNYYEGNRFYVSPVWKPTEKTALRLRLEQGKRQYKGAPAGQVASDRRDTTSLASVSAEWEVSRALSVAATLQRDTRRSNAPGAAYSANTIGVSALFRF